MKKDSIKKNTRQEETKENAKKILILEFGVAAGAGLLNLCKISEILSDFYKVDYEIIGFDGGSGLPEPIDYRDHPELYKFGDYPAMGLEKIKLPNKTKIIYGDIAENVNSFTKICSDKLSKIGFISIDVDYYSSTIDALKVLSYEEFNYLSSVVMYFDDVGKPEHNKFCGELLAINEFNNLHDLRKICKMNNIKNNRIYRNADYLDHMYYCHIFDSSLRNKSIGRKGKAISLPR